jgi:rfaE bifunctional protein nucleotidyltransferase chain/domain
MKKTSTEVLVTGTFNVVHAGHVRLLEFASRFGKVTVGINADPYLKEKYGEKAVSLVDRSYVLLSCKFVDEVVMFREDEPSDLILSLQPEVYIKGPDYTIEALPELKALKKARSKIIIHPANKEYNSSELVQMLKKSAFQNFKKYS